MSKACLVAWISTEHIPTVTRVGIYSEEWPTPSPVRKDLQPACLYRADGSSYDDARKRLVEKLAQERNGRLPGAPRWLGWVYLHLQEADKAAVDAVGPLCPHCGGKLETADA